MGPVPYRSGTDIGVGVEDGTREGQTRRHPLQSDVGPGWGCPSRPQTLSPGTGLARRGRGWEWYNPGQVMFFFGNPRCASQWSKADLQRTPVVSRRPQSFTPDTTSGPGTPGG